MLIKPNVKSNWNWNGYLKEDVNEFMKNINFETSDISGKTLYLQSKGIMQAKLRESGFTITRNKDKADVIVIDDLIKKSVNRYDESRYHFHSSFNSETFFDEIIQDESKNYKYIYTNELYKYLYKYEGNLELFNQLNDLLSSNSRDNTKMAMEMMSNANWEGNEIYLQELFNIYWYGSFNCNMRSNQYRNSISFKGFLNSLEFNYESLDLMDAMHYRELCLTEEHHNWVYEKYKQQFKNELDYLVKKHKIKLDRIEYSIDKNIIYENED